MPDAACIDGTPYFFHDGASGLEISYPESWRQRTEIVTEKTRQYRRISFEFKAADGRRPVVLRLTIYPIDPGDDASDRRFAEPALQNDRYLVIGFQPSADPALTGEDLVAYVRLSADAEKVVRALRFRRGNGVGDCRSYSLELCPTECVVCPPCPECSSVSCQSAEFCRTLGIGRDWYKD